MGCRGQSNHVVHESFYEHLVRGESASESLHQAMKSMRENHFSDVMQWAPFMLIGDDVTFNGLYLIKFLGFSSCF